MPPNTIAPRRPLPMGKACSHRSAGSLNQIFKSSEGVEFVVSAGAGPGANAAVAGNETNDLIDVRRVMFIQITSTVQELSLKEKPAQVNNRDESMR